MSDLKPLNFTARELALVELALQSDELNQGSPPAKFWEELRECRKEKLDRQNPEWRHALLASYQNQRRAIDDFQRWTKVILDTFGTEGFRDIYERLEKGELP